METKRPTYLSDPVWMETPWKHAQKTPWDKIFDVLTGTPELFRRGQDIERLDLKSQLREAVEMINECWRIDSTLQQLCDKLESGSPGPLYWPELSKERLPVDDSDLGKVFPVAFQFFNLSTAATLLTLWGVQTMLWHAMWQLYRLILETVHHTNITDKTGSETSPPSSTVTAPSERESITGKIKHVNTSNIDGSLLPPLGFRADFAEPARNICQSAEYCLQEETLDTGPLILAAPLSIVVQILREYPQYSREVAWASAVFQKVAQRSLRLLNYEASLVAKAPS